MSERPLFRPEVWSPAMAEVLRHNLTIQAWNQTGTRTAAEQEAKLEAYRAREAKRRTELAAMEARLTTFPDILQPIIQLHFPDRGECMGCDYDGYESEPPAWPCRTIKTILGEPVD